MYIGDQFIELENDDDEPDDNQQEREDIDENIYLDDDKLLMIQRSLHTNCKKEEP